MNGSIKNLEYHETRSLFNNGGEGFKKRALFTLVEVPEARQHGSKRAAFTLAEVLITLGIIGIVAAMTIPTLMKSYQTKIRDVQFKKVYSTLNQAFMSIQADYGYTPLCYYGRNGTSTQTRECVQFYGDLFKKLKLMRTCPNAVQTGCMPRYDGIDTIYKPYVIEQHKNDPDFAEHDDAYWSQKAREAITGCGGFSQSYIDNDTAYVLADGTIIFLYMSTMPVVAVDINGVAGPNLWGHDLFSFSINCNGKNFRLSGEHTCMAAQKGGVTTTSLTRKLYGAGFD